MYEQLNIFSFLEEAPKKAFSWDDDINEIHKRLHALADRYHLAVDDEEWSIWSHVKNLGYRMDIGLIVTRDIMNTEQFFKDIDVIVEYAKSKNISLNPMYNAIFFFEGENTATLTIFSIFMDKARRKRKSW